MMDNAEFEDFIEDTSYRAVFCSCSPGEKSYSSNKLKHGIWTWHLIESLAGRIDEALVRDFYITDVSLKDYLSYAIPIFIRKNTDIRSTQTPYAVVSSKNTFEIRKLQNDRESSTKLPQLTLNYKTMEKSHGKRTCRASNADRKSRNSFQAMSFT
jgi:hypothetical protein